MASTYNPFGILSSDTQTSAAWSGKLEQNYQIDPTYTDTLTPGDPVTLAGGYVVKYDTAAQNADAPVLGSFLGCSYTSASSGYVVPYFGAWLGAAANVATGSPVYASVEDNTDIIFKVQSDSVTGNLVTAVGKNARFNFGTATTLSLSVPQSVDGLASATISAANTGYPLKVIGYFPGTAGAYNQVPTLNGWSTTGPNAVTISYPTLLVKINNHVYRSGTAGIA